MRISYERYDNSIRFYLFCEDADKARSPHLGSQSEFSYSTTDGSTFPESHPDRVALVALLNSLPLAGERIHFGWPVSKTFLEASKIISRIQISAEEGQQEPAAGNPSGIPCLSFSGGADSTAALAVMPPETESVFMLRKKSYRRSLYDSDAAIESCRLLSEDGKTVHIIESDFEYLRNPIGFPTDLSVATPSILLFDSRNFSSIALGTILESAYGTSGSVYREYLDSSHYRLWSRMFSAVGIGYSLPVAGVSEVASSIICNTLPEGRFHQSCIRGKWESPCQSCWKCFRKNTLMAALNGWGISRDVSKMVWKSREVRKHLIENKPIKHEGVLTYSLERAKGGGEAFEKLRKLVRVGKINTRWMERWYSHSESLIPESYRKFTTDLLKSTIGVMDENDVIELENWSNHNDIERESLLAAFTDLVGR